MQFRIVSCSFVTTLTSMLLTRCGECDEQSVQLFHRADEELELEAGLDALEIVMPFATVVSIDLEPVDP
ncbi:hypothetical protein [Nannocystis radixulma]|uniref:Secreted protein n=1 Tax=Nannocystis radixulma TaxID=2995305 RepID=A0ABT5B7I6_9BACT|nr:hypothetical protein [Nannocystis radixulma]MDC0670078.1 hypothetical protein [Nannocystis radixulma]